MLSPASGDARALSEKAPNGRRFNLAHYTRVRFCAAAISALRSANTAEGSVVKCCCGRAEMKLECCRLLSGAGRSQRSVAPLWPTFAMKRSLTGHHGEKQGVDKVFGSMAWIQLMNICTLDIFPRPY